MTPVSHGKPCAGNPHARFDEGASASEEPRRNALLHIMKLTADQIVILERCVGQKSMLIPIQWFKGMGYLFSSKDEHHDLDINGGVVKSLFDIGYLQMRGENTCILTDAGRCALVDVQNQTSKKGVRE